MSIDSGLNGALQKCPFLFFRFLFFLLVFLLAVFLCAPAQVLGAPDDCLVAGNMIHCEGDQSAGIVQVVPPTVDSLRIDNLTTTIQPAPGVDGIRFRSERGGNLNLFSGRTDLLAEIETTGNSARGIFVETIGTPPTPGNDLLLNVPIPGSPHVSGGEVLVESYSDIETNGSNAHGIAGFSKTTGYPATMITALENFSEAGIRFVVTEVADPQTGNPQDLDPQDGVTVQGRIAHFAEIPGEEDRYEFLGYGDSAGVFTIYADGNFSFAMGEDFDDLEVGEERIVSVRIELDGYRNDLLRRSGESGELIAVISKKIPGEDDEGNPLPAVLEVMTSAYIDTFGSSDRPQSEALAWPDLDQYVKGLLDEAQGAGGAGNSVTLNHLGGDIVTRGAASYGVFAESRGRLGSNGRHGGGFFSFGSRPPTAGGTGNPGGDVLVWVDGSITTRFEPTLAQPNQSSFGVLAHSLGGHGGTGGNGGTYYGGRQGGTGGDGGLVEVYGSGRVETYGHYATGILALSEGGDGGLGGDGGFAAGGALGGYGGQGGEVIVAGTWDVTTRGDQAHGIWAKSVGGNAGAGGSGGWLTGGPGGGGQATDGGQVTLLSGGVVETFGADSFGLFGQSVGGFGGSGGSGGGIFYSRGGDGNSAGSGGQVFVTNQPSGEIRTHGQGSHALVALSIGGGGGAGGSAAGLVGVGGTGAAGGFGGSVEANNAGLIETLGSHARGLYAQSVGGGGGDGGSSAGLVAIGGGGSGTSDGGSVTVHNSGSITTGTPMLIGGELVTQGTWSEAIFAQSIGGGGGSGGSSSGWFSFGGKGGGGGDGVAVSVHNSGTLMTYGDDASALVAQSVGGGGGSGGNSVATGAFVSMAIGGEGGDGGVGGEVNVTSQEGRIVTLGDRARGIDAQSVGGGGGRGGFAFAASGGVGLSISVGVGGDGGGGGDADAVRVNSSSDINTQGEDAQGIFAQSIGGGGGSGGFSIAVAGSDGVGVALAFGGKGGTAGDGKSVTVESRGEISTTGLRAVGLFAQSIGGGGGSGGFSLAGSGGGLGGFSLGLGGDGGGGGNADVVRVESYSLIRTLGDEAHGLQAQSVGGGGGSGGFSIAAAGGGTGAASISVGGKGAGGGDGHEVDVVSMGRITTEGIGAIGLFAQSVGGGGGSGGFSISGAGAGTGAGAFSLGGAGAAGGAGERVSVESGSEIHTLGNQSHALLAQSVGGGGGSGGFSLAGAGAGTGAATFGLGGSAGGGGNSQRVAVISTGALMTEGDGAIGLFAQSVGGGGGSGGFSVAGAGAGTGAGTFSMGGAGGDGGKGHEVWVSSASQIYTLGLESHALFAQSIGGGGGSGGFTLAGAGAGTGAGTLSLGGSAGGGGDGDLVEVLSTGNLVTEGDAAVGLFAQSVGGGGGSGGFSIAGAGAGQGAGTISLGGSGGDGGSGASVLVDNQGAILTLGEEAYGLFAQSVGGGGGRGGFNISGSGAKTFGGTLGLGGSGGNGGSAGAVQVTNAGGVETHGVRATGLFVQSVGGGGGVGGFSISGSLGGGQNATAVSLSLGGSGGLGGDAGAVDVINTASLWTRGEEASGILGQSIGGGGGQGGFSIAGAFIGTHNVSVGIGGSGGDGGAGGDVRIDNRADILTQGASAYGIRAESTSDGGGDGGFVLSGSLGGKDAKNIAVGVGGSGGEGGIAGTVEVDHAGVLTTLGAGSHGILASSIGGGGGSGGSSISVGFGIGGEKSWNVNASISVGGSGGDGGLGGEVKVGSQAPVSGLIQTHSEDAHGIMAQSIGGGGGQGGSSTALNIDVDRPKPENGDENAQGGNTLNVAVAVGGSGGDGNRAGAVAIDNAADIVTRGAQSHGIFAQSIGGGGGSGGRSAALSLSTSDLMPWKEMQGDNWGLDLSVGGSGGDGNTGGAVSVINRGHLLTEGVLSRGIVAQSIGGGGGSGAQGILGTGVDWLDDALGALSPVQMAFELKGIIENPKELLPKSASISVGGSGGDNGHADAVGVENFGDITTRGWSSHAIFAQSIGGGGGEAQLYARGQGEGAEAAVGIGLLGEIAVGGAGGSAGDGANVDILHAGNIWTQGEAASGIFAQSIGGGGGQAGSIQGGFSDPASIGLGLAFGRDGGSAGDGGAVTVTSAGEIVTNGEAAVAVFAQSIGGGGGIIGDVGGLAFAGSVGGYGSAGAVTVNHDGFILTSGTAAHGIMAQSVGGADNDVYQGKGGAVSVSIDGHIHVEGADATAILAQSLGGGAGGNSTIHIVVQEGGTVLGGSGAGAGVRMLDGSENLLTNHGLIWALSELAISGTSGNDRIENHGMLRGSVLLGEGTNLFTNHAGGVIDAGLAIDLGTGNLLTNAGMLSPGGEGQLAATTLSGDLLQTETGLLVMDLDVCRSEADHVGVSGSVQLAGQVRVSAVDAGYAKPGAFSVDLVTADSGLVDEGVTLGYIPSAVAGYVLSVADDSRLRLNYVVDFSPVALNLNQAAIGDHVNRVQSAGGAPSFAPLAAALFSLPDAAALGAAYNRLTPEVYLGTEATSLAANSQLSNAMFSCPQFEGENRFTAEGDCNWMRVSGRGLIRDATAATLGYKEKAVGVAGGMQVEVADRLFFGFGLAYEDSTLRSADLARTEGDLFQAGVMIKRHYQATLLAAGLSGGIGRYNATRFVDIPEPGLQARGKQDMRFLALRGRLAHTLEHNIWYLRPLLEGNLTYSRFDGFSESGAGAANLVVQSRNETYLSLNPALEIGAEARDRDDVLVRFFVRAGAIHYLSGTRPEITASLEGAPVGVAPFRVKGEMDRTYLDLAVGANILNKDSIGIRMEYSSQLSSDTRQHGGMIKLTVPF